jgi:methionyl-tRNA formyltransferase
VPSLEALAKHPDFRVTLVVTQPDKPVGRHQILTSPLVKKVATRLGIPVFQPESLRKDPAAPLRLAQEKADAYVVASYGKILPKEILALPRLGCLNVHASLLPKYRGASPISAAIAAGETKTGITIMLMDEGLDTGPTLSTQETCIKDEDTTATLTTRLADVGAELVATTLKAWLAGEIKSVPQPNDGMTVTKQLSKDDGRIDWSKDADIIEHHVRAMTPWPTAWTTWTAPAGAPTKILVKKASLLHPTVNCNANSLPGLVCASTQGLAVNCGRGSILLERVQLEGKSETDGRSLVNGHPTLVGSVLGQPETPTKAPSTSSPKDDSSKA